MLMRALATWCGAVLVLTSAACADDDEPELASGLPRPLAGVYDDFDNAPTDARFRALMAFPTRDVAELERAIDEMYDPKHPSFRQYMSVDTWMERHAPSEADLAVVEGWLLTYGMTRERTSKNRLLFQFSGSVEQFNRAFKTELHAFERENPSAGSPPLRTYGALKPLKVPAKIAELAESVVAVDLPAETGELSPEGGEIVEMPPEDVAEAFTPAQIAHAYGLGELYSAGYRGQGVKLGVVVGATYKLKDLQSFWQSFGIRRDNPKHVETAEPVSTRYLETTLDAQWSGGLAPEADLITYEGPDARTVSILYAFNEAVAAGEASVLSTSFAHREETEAEPIRFQYHDASRMGAALGMTIVVASGDSSMPDVPSSSPYVTCVGGTLLELGADGEVASEEAWSGSGSGLARSFPRPAWQKAAVKDNGGKRAVSDVAMNASPESQYWLHFLGKWDHRGGTSFAAPAFAGLIAVVNSYRAANGAPMVGWLNPALYNDTEVQAAFRDITAGKTPFYPAGPGWDYPTGWGAPLAGKLAPALP
jgi:kumamolisin